MTAPDSSPTRPLRVAGLALLGLAAIALVIGLVTAFGGNGDDQAGGNGGGQGDAQPPASSASSEPGSSGADQPPATASSTTPPSPTTSSPGSESAVPTAPPGGDGNGEPRKNERVRVLNNSKISGLAADAGSDLEEAGWTVDEVGNYPSGVIPTTTVYFRPDTAEQAAAELLADEFGMRAEPRFTGIADQPPGLIVIVTNDYQGPGGERDPAEKNDK